MARFISVSFAILIASDFGQTLRAKMDFGEESESTSVMTNSSKENEDVEVQHTIVVSTKLKNTNRRGLQSPRDDYTHNSRYTSNVKREESGEVPVIKGYKAVETTQIFTPDTRQKIPVNSAHTFTSHNAPDEYDFYPNLAINPMQFKPSNFYNNINWWNHEDTRSFNNFMGRNDKTSYLNTQQSGFQRGLRDNSVRDFYCKKCRELSGSQGMRGCAEQPRNNQWYTENTMLKTKTDGKLVKLN